MPGIGAFISPGRSLDSALDRVRLADELGFDSVYTTHIAGRDSLTVLAMYASVTERVRLGTGVVPIFSRTPAAMAQTAATIDEFSGGRMVLRLAGEIGDGVMLWLCNPDYIRDVVVPSVREGRERAGKSLDGFDIVPAVTVALTDDPDAARATLRQELVTYASLPFYRAMLERSGFGDDLAAFDEGMQAGDLERAKSGLSDRMLGALAGIGSADEVRAAVERYRDAGTTSPCIGGIPGTDFDGALDAVAELL